MNINNSDHINTALVLVFEAAIELGYNTHEIYERAIQLNSISPNRTSPNYQQKIADEMLNSLNSAIGK